VLAALLLAAVILIVIAGRDTMGMPVVRHTSVELEGLDPAHEPVRIALISDIHMGGPDMSPKQLARIVDQINALDPDVIMIAGDILAHRAMITQSYTLEEAVAPLAALDAPLGVVAVPGNHDHVSGVPALGEVMERNGILLLPNDAAAVGPLAVGGFDGSGPERRKLATLMEKLHALPGGGIVLTHGPDIFAQLPPSVSLTLAGHTHCGQIVWPWGHAPVTSSRFGQRYACGRVDEDGKVLITSAGLGTSVIPLRLFAPRDIWLIVARPPSASAPGGLEAR
jgi:predicted MPP superfamily phosphohydrolase